MIAMILGGVFLLGVCIVIHELGHMWMGRLVGVRAEIFSFGYGRGIWKKKVGDTTYQITAIPLGGYVKFYGDDMQDTENKVPGGFFSVPPLVRIVPVLGGPLFNLILGFLIFLGVAAFSGLPPAKVQLQEELGEQSPAYKAGLQNGDRLISIDGQPVKSFDEIAQVVGLSGGKSLSVVYERAGVQGQTVLVPDLLPSGIALAGLRLPGQRFIEVDFPFKLSLQARIAKLFGLTFSDTSVRAIQYLDDGDVILAVQGEKVSNPVELKELLGRYHGQEVKIDLRRQTMPLLAPWFTEETSVVVPTRGEYAVTLTDVVDSKYNASLGTMVLRSEMTEYQSALGDMFFDGEAAGSFQRLYDRFREGKRVPVVIGSGAGGHAYMATVRAEKTGLIGFRPIPMIEPESSHAIVGVKDVFASAASDTAKNIMALPQFIGQLAAGRISFIDNATGPVGMFAVAGVALKTDISTYFRLMAMISIALMVMNLLPFPVVDGGHIVFFLIEAVLRRPLPLSVLEGAYRFGFITLVLFGLVIMVKDLGWLVNM